MSSVSRAAVPFLSSAHRHALPSTGSHRVGSPASSATTACSDSSSPLPCSLFAPPGSSTDPAVETARSPGFLGNPPVHALLSDPGRIAAPDHRASPYLCACDVAFRTFDCVGSDYVFLTRLHHTACTLAVYASWPRSPVTACQPRKTRFRLVVRLAGRDSNPLGSSVKFPSCYRIASSSPRLCPAHPESRVQGRNQRAQRARFSNAGAVRLVLVPVLVLVLVNGLVRGHGLGHGLVHVTGTFV